jgi:uncharacterized surface anchored protein
VTCTYVNTERVIPVERGSITINKVAATDYRVFHFRFVVDGIVTKFELAGGESKTFPDLEAGQYVIREIDPDGWHLEDLTCTPEGDNIDIDLENLKVTIDLEGGQNIECTFVNEKGEGSPPPSDPTDDPTQQPSLPLIDVLSGQIQDNTVQQGAPGATVADPATDPALAIQELPRTGVNVVRIFFAGLVLIAMGALLLLHTRRNERMAAETGRK